MPLLYLGYSKKKGLTTMKWKFENYDVKSAYERIRDSLQSEVTQYSKAESEALSVIIEESYLRDDEEFRTDYFDAAVDHLCKVYGKSEASKEFGKTKLEFFNTDEKKIHGTEVQLRAFKEEATRLASLIKDDLEYNRTLNLDELTKLYKLCGIEKTGWENITDENYGMGA